MPDPRILEIGAWTYCKDAYPDSTTLLWTGERPYRNAGQAGADDCTPGRFLARCATRAGRYDVVVTYMQVWPAWHPRYWLRSLLREPLRPFAALTRVFGVSWLRWVRPVAPFAAIDMNDSFVIGRHNFFLLDSTDAAFKRELPADRWLVLCHSAHAAIPTRRIRRQPRWIARMEKLRPVVLPAAVLERGTADFPEKNTDLFFSGDVSENSWIRSTGRAELDALAARGVTVDIPKQRLSHAAFLERMSRAWLAWSPAGFGWECYRTAEAAQCLTVPVINYPTIERHAPLRDGEHAVFYDVAPGELTRAVEKALQDKPKLKQMALAARDHVVTHHVGRAVIDYVVAETRRIAGA